MIRRGRKSRRGFTLVELTMIVAVSSVALVATAGAVTSGARLAQTASETRAAIRSTQSLMEQVRATPYANLATAFNAKSFAMSALGCGNTNGSCAVTVTPVNTTSAKWTAVEVRVTATWTGAAGAATQTMATIVCDRANGAVN